MDLDPSDIDSSSFQAFIAQNRARTIFSSAPVYLNETGKKADVFCSFFESAGHLICVPSLRPYAKGDDVPIRPTGETIIQTGMWTFIAELAQEIPLEIYTNGIPVIE